MNLSYEDCKELKDAGFPQKDEVHCFGSQTSDFDNCIYVPTLSELIEECGGNRKTFILHHKMGKNNGWICQRGTFVFKGKTPEQAVSRLWLELKKK